jgi:hypothetical protein
MNNFNQENLDFITHRQYTKILTSHYRSFPKLIKLIYFNPEYSMNSTLKFVETDALHLYTYENDKFIPLSKEYVIDTLIMKLWALLYDHYQTIDLETFKMRLISEETFDRIEEFMIDYRKLCTGVTPGSIKEIQSLIYETIRFHSLEKKKTIIQIFAREHKTTLTHAKQLWKNDSFACFIKKHIKQVKRDYPNDDNEVIYKKLKSMFCTYSSS